MEGKIRLAVFGQKRLSREGGIEIVVKELCTRMAQNGCEVTCYNRAGHHVSGAEYDKTIEYDGIRQKVVPTIEKKGLAAVSSSFFAALCSAFGRYDVVHQEHGGMVTLFTHPNSHPYDSGLIVADKNGEVKKWLAKEDERPQYYRNRVNAGLHVISPKVLELVDIDADSIGKIGANGKPVKVDLDRQLLKPLAGTGKMFCYDSPEYVKDMGTPERYYSVCADYKEGRVSGKNLKNKQKAVFLDRDHL